MTLLKILLFNGIILKFDWFINTSAVLIWQVLVCTKVLKGHGDFQKGRGPSFEQTWIHFTHWCFVPSLVEIGPCSGSGEEKFTTTTTTTDKFWSEKLTWAILRLTWAKNMWVKWDFLWWFISTNRYWVIKNIGWKNHS